MFGKKQKFSASHRFQRRDFSRRVSAARGYKRTIRKAPETKFQAGLNKFGLGSRLTQVSTLLVLAGLVYLVFIPNFLFIKDVKIEGAQDTGSVQNSVNNYFEQKKGLWPQKNIIFLNSKSLEEFLKANDPSVLQVDSIRKRPWNKIVITVRPRVERFSLSTQAGDAVLYNDGVMARKLSGDQKFPPGLAHLKISTDDEIQQGHQYLPIDLSRTIDEIFNTFPGATGKVLHYIEIPVVRREQKPEATESPESLTEEQEIANEEEILDRNHLILFVKKDPAAKDERTNFRVYIDPGQSIAEAETVAKEMFAQLPTDRLNALYYMDLRFKGKAYVCLRNAACSRVPLPATPPPAAVPAPVPLGATKPVN